MKRTLNSYLKLIRLFLSLAVSFSAAAGLIAFSHSFNQTILYVFLGVFFMATSASALNQYQERHLDALMIRTQKRPLPGGQIDLCTAMAVIILLGLAGASLLFFCTTSAAAILGIFSLLWYNGIYTPMKRKTQYAVIAGAITGSLPPMIGWAAAGGKAFDPEILLFSFFMFLWQIPHFWLLLLRFGEDYENAGFPSLASVMNERQIKSTMFIWVVSAALSTILFPFYNLIFSSYLIGSLILADTLLISFFYRNIFISNINFNLRQASRSLYYYQVLVLILVIIEALK